MLLSRLTCQRLELTDPPVTSRETEQYEPRRQKSAVAEVIDRGDQLLAREVTGHTEDDQRARIGHTWQPTVARVAQGVTRPRGWLFHRAVTPARRQRPSAAAASRLCGQ